MPITTCKYSGMRPSKDHDYSLLLSWRPCFCRAKVPPSPCGVERSLSGDAAEFWNLLAGSKVQLTPEETGVVQRRLEEGAAKNKEGDDKEGGRRGTVRRRSNYFSSAF